MSENKNVGQRVATAVENVVKKIEVAADTAVEAIHTKAEETIEKLGRAAHAVTAPFADADKFLDELIGGHNGGPALDDATFPADIREAAGQPIEARPGAATAAAPRPSALGTPTGGVTASDVDRS